ncbi:MAG: tRNA (adenosine(37)-N6)-dimethylallyltransferase MiaA [bacterium]|nr:tRNA (adenosine(37)-N6)-dimethylallyltransferase MiaA [bacterium]
MTRLKTKIESQKKLIAIVGPTSSGKSDLGVFLAKQFQGEVISADSRQVYRGLDIGAGKITKKEQKGVPHHLLDIASPKQTFSVARYQKLANKAIQTIQQRGNTPFLVGGSPFYVYTVCDGLILPEVKPNAVLRARLEKYSAQELHEMLKELDPVRAHSLQDSSGQDKNKRRLTRALEIVLETGKPVPPFCSSLPLFSALFIGIDMLRETLLNRVHSRLIKRVRGGMVAEVKKLHKEGLSWKRMEELGLEYRWMSRFLRNKISKEQMLLKLEQDTMRFVKRQLGWFTKDKRVHWVSNKNEASCLVASFLLNQ